MKTLICDCNRTMPLTPQSLAPVSQALAKTPLASAEGLETVHTLLCRREAGAFQRAATSGEAPGYSVVITTTGNSMSGHWSTRSRW